MKKKTQKISKTHKKDYYDKLEMPKDFLDDETTSPEWQEREYKKISQTSSQKKMWTYMKDLTKRSAFRNDLRKFRKKFNIPEKGYDKPDYQEQEIEAQGKNYRESLISFARKYKLSFLWEDVLECYIFYNDFHYKFLINTAGSMVDVEDIYSLLTGNYGEEIEGHTMQDYIKQKSEQYPVAIFLNPYVSQRDVIDYVKKTFKVSIEPKLKWYREEGVRLGKARRKNSRVEARDEFIFNSRDKSKKEIVSLVAKNFGDILDYTYIARIIKEQERVRK